MPSHPNGQRVLRGHAEDDGHQQADNHHHRRVLAVLAYLGHTTQPQAWATRTPLRRRQAGNASAGLPMKLASAAGINACRRPAPAARPQGPRRALGGTAAGPAASPERQNSHAHGGPCGPARATRSRRSRSAANCAPSCTAFDRYSWKVMARPRDNDCRLPWRPTLALTRIEHESYPEIHPQHCRITWAADAGQDRVQLGAICVRLPASPAQLSGVQISLWVPELGCSASPTVIGLDSGWARITAVRRGNGAWASAVVTAHNRGVCVPLRGLA